MKRIVSLLCILCMLASFCGCGNNGGGTITVYDKDGVPMAHITDFNCPDKEMENPAYRSYVLTALGETITAFATTYNCSEEKAAKKLLKEEYAVHTAFDPVVFAAAEKMYASYEKEKLPLGCAVTDYDGNVLAVFSGGDQTYALVKHPPFSTMKPLSVYMQGIENGLMDWSTRITDEPYKKIADSAGVLQKWPVNPNNTYTYQETTLTECIRKSLNTTAVHGLKTVGVEQSIRFLQDAFDMDLAYEQNKVTIEGAEEVIGNLALGYLYTGVTPVELAGYYQVFGNGGKYVKPHTVQRIVAANGKAVYTNKTQAKQVIGEDTAYIMNRLLQSVVMPGGTGAKAKIDGVELVGKTGTGNEDGGNWFVGVTPQYTCAVWHGVTIKNGNISAQLFTEIMKNMPKHTVTQFKTCDKILKGVYCSQSGNLFSSSCLQMQVGYYASDRRPKVCDEH